MVRPKKLANSLNNSFNNHASASPEPLRIRSRYSRPQTANSDNKYLISVNRSFTQLPAKTLTKIISNEKTVDKKISYRECAVNDPKLPPINEMEHRVSQCYCYLCNCGKHKCPGDYNPNRNSSIAQFSTNYKIEYYKKQRYQTSIAINNPLYTPNKNPIESVTIKSQDYKPHKIEPFKKIEKKTYEKSNIKFSGKSCYDADYLN